MKSSMAFKEKIVNIECWIIYMTLNTVAIDAETDGFNKPLLLDHSEVEVLYRHDGFVKSRLRMTEEYAKEKGIEHLIKG